MNCISIDWLQLHCKKTDTPLFDAPFTESGAFGIIKKDIRSNVFKQHREILSSLSGAWEACAVISFDPLSGILPVDSCHLKIINKYLYHSDLNRLVYFLLQQLQLKFVSVSRLDVAMDFKKFFRGLTVPQFFKQVLEKKYLKRRCTSISIEGKATRLMPVHYMRFGSKNSPVQFYVYNKSKELREKTDKPYIRDKWIKYRMNPESSDIWRIEFVLHPSQFGLIEGDTGEAIEFNTLDILDENFIRKLFYALLLKYAQFVFNDGQKRKERMKKVQLFQFKEKIENIFIRVTQKQTSNRMDKVFIRKLYELNKEWRLHNKDEPTSGEVLHDFIDKRDLQKWYDEKMISTTITNQDENKIPVNYS